VLQTLKFNVADVEFRCCRHVRRRRKLLMLAVASLLCIQIKGDSKDMEN
jgi:hypothetical protein